MYKDKEMHKYDNLTDDGMEMLVLRDVQTGSVVAEIPWISVRPHQPLSMQEACIIALDTPIRVMTYIGDLANLPSSKTVHKFLERLS
ncbi:MAG: hypothetical protein ACRD63_11975 [Pyrinomonadaceae bacterium]